MLKMVIALFQFAIDAVENGKVEVPFDYHGHTPVIRISTGTCY